MGKVAADAATNAFGFRMEEPTRAEAKHYMRDLSWDERIEVLSQGYHRGCYLDQCYSIEQFERYVSKRNPRDPTGGVRTLDIDEVTKWLEEVVGDKVLARAFKKAYRESKSEAEAIDIVRVLLNVRINQYYETKSTEDVF